jgi:septum site-determining protein MinC
MAVDAVTIKGTSDGVVISLGEGPLAQVLSEMEDQLAAKASFFRGGRAALRVAERSLSVEQLGTIGAKIEELGMTLWAVQSDHPETGVAAQELGLETALQSSSPAEPAAPERIAREEMEGRVVRRTLRSGQTVHHPGHVTIIGDVNPGAEVVASGDVVVWGKLRGTVHAGAAGDDGAIVCALQLAPSQIRIGAHIARSPERGRPPKAPEMASVQDGGIVVEPWNKRR